MKEPCTFCDRGPDILERVFYERHDWYAFLAAPPYAHGHTIVARQRAEGVCPKTLFQGHLQGIDRSLSDVLEAIRSYYRPKDVLVASLRGKEAHVHWHLIPLWEVQEREWRLSTPIRNYGDVFSVMRPAAPRSGWRGADADPPG